VEQFKILKENFANLEYEEDENDKTHNDLLEQEKSYM